MAYLDIGVDNGGIVLNLSEEGMALQAVAPLHGQTDVSLRIQIPGSRTRIKTAARIVWRSESNRQVGVRFVELPAEGRTQLRQWVRYEVSPNAPLETAASQPEIKVEAKIEDEPVSQPQPVSPNALLESAVSQPEAKGEEVKPKDAPQSSLKPTPEPRNYKWTKLMSKAVAEISALQETPSPQKTEISENLVIAPSDQKRSNQELPEPEISAKTNGEPVEPLETVARTIENRLQETPSSIRPQTSEMAVIPGGHQNLQGNGNSSYPLQAVDQAILDWRAAASPVAPVQETERSTPLSTFTEPPAPALVSKPGNVSAISIPAPASLSARVTPALNKWVLVGGLFVLFSILSFSIGRWAAPQSARNESAKISSPPSADAPRSLPGIGGSVAPEVTQPAPRINRKSHAQRATREFIPENQDRGQGLPSAPPAVAPVEQSVPSAPSVQSLPPVPATKQPESSSAPVLAPAPAPEEPTVAQAAPRIVDGRVLKLTDRFNPCYLTYRVEPEYPEEALRSRIEGAVKIHLNIAANGTVASMKLLSGSPILAPAALEAAKYWQYLPALLNGQPVETGQDIEIDFRLPY